MSRGDWVSTAVTLILTGGLYFVSGPKAAGLCMVVGLVVIIAIHLLGKKEEEPISSKGAEIKDSFNPIIRQESNPQIHVHTHPPQPPAAVSTVTANEELPAELQYVGDKVTCVRHDRCVYVTDDISPPNGVAAIFTNTLKPRRLHTPTAHQVAARLTFRNKDGEETHINYAAWDGEITHYRQFKAGERHRLLIYLQEGGVTSVGLASYYERNPFGRFFRSGTTVYSPKSVPLVADFAELEIALLDGDAAVFHGTFACEKDEGGFMRLSPL